jgi:RimJ/RimL family protein N-acetyltransferase
MAAVRPELAPLFGLRIRTARLEVRLPTDADLEQLAATAEGGIHPPEDMPFAVPWTDAIGEPGFRHGMIAFHLGLRHAWRPDRWALACGVFAEGAVMGIQQLDGIRFAEHRRVTTGSWLGTPFQGRGYGTEMRAAALHLAFAGLGAEVAESGAFVTNPRSARVSEKLGYEETGTDVVFPRGVPVEERRFRLTAAAWRATTQIPVELHGLQRCRPLFGV